MADHLLGDLDVDVVLAVVDLELEADEAGQDGGGARLRPDRSDSLACGRADYGEAVSWHL